MAQAGVMTTCISTRPLVPRGKSRKGCLSCKQRRLKCDESKPACKNCISRSLECPGYQPIFKWLPQAQTNQGDFLSKSKKKRRKCVRDHEVEYLSTATEFNGVAGWTMSAQGDSSHLNSLSADPIEVVDDVGSPSINTIPFTRNWNYDVRDQDHYQNLASTPLKVEVESMSQWGLLMDMELFSRPLVIRNSVRNPESYASLPQMFPDGETAQPSSPRWMSGNDSPPQAMTVKRPDVRGLLKGFYGVQPSIPAPMLHHATRLVEYYFSTVSGIYSCFDSHLNPFRSFVGHMWTVSASMYYAIQSMAAGHLANDLPSMRKVGIDLHDQASQYLSSGLSTYYSQGTGDGQALLVLLLLGLSSSWHRPGDLGLHYLRTARSLVQLNPTFNGHNTSQSPGPLHELFEEAMVYWEMMISFVANPTDISVMHSNQDSTKATCQISPHNSSLVTTGTPHPWTGVSPQSQMLLAEVGRLVRRVRTTNRRLRRSAETESLGAATALEESLLALEPEAVSLTVDSGDHCTSPSHLITMAQVTRDCGLLELYRTFPALLRRRLGVTSSFPAHSYHPDNSSGIDRHTWLTSFAIHILHNLKSIPDSSSVRANQLLLLLLPAAELRFPPRNASSSVYESRDEEREISRARRFATARLAQLAVLLPARPVRVMIDLLDEVWRRMDSCVEGDVGLEDYDGVDGDDVFWVDVMIEKGWHTVMG